MNVRQLRLPPTRSHRIAIGLVALAAVAGLATVVLRQSTTAPVAWMSDTSGTPATPLAWRGNTGQPWDVLVHSRDAYSHPGFQDPNMTPLDAQHGPDCSGPPATHQVSSVADSVYLCNNHIMTASADSGYGVIYLTPPSMMDWSGGISKLTFAVSTERLSQRDWINFWFTPFDENLVSPLGMGADPTQVDLQGPPKDAVAFGLDLTHNYFTGSVCRLYDCSTVPQHSQSGYESCQQISPATRTFFEIDISATHLKMGEPACNLWWVDTDIAAIPFSQAVVQVGHHSYTPTKDAGCGPPATSPYPDCRPTTWHWSNFSMTASDPLAIDNGLQQVATAGAATVDLATPAPANAHLRFDAFTSGSQMQVSFDGGQSYVNAPLQGQRGPQGSGGLADEHAKGFWVAAPAGATTVTFKGANWWGGPWMVEDPSVWAVGSAPPPPTDTPSPTPSDTPAATPSPTPTPSATACVAFAVNKTEPRA